MCYSKQSEAKQVFTMRCVVQALYTVCIIIT